MTRSSGKLLTESAKYLNSEGIYYKKSETNLFACVNGQFVMFEFGDKQVNRKLEASGGRRYHPRSLLEVIGFIRDVQGEVIGRR